MDGEGSTHAVRGDKGDGGRTTEESNGAPQLDGIFAALADSRRRFVVQYFRNASHDVATVTDLAHYVADRGEDDFESVAVTLHHKDISKLAEAGIVEYDSRTETVKYVGSPLVSEFLDSVDRDGDRRSPTGATAEPGALDHLSDALAADDSVEKDYCIRQALQYIHFESDESA